MKTISDDERIKIFNEFGKISLEETPALALKRHGTTPPDNWEDITREIRERHGGFYKEHPYFYLPRLLHELKTIVESPNVIFKNTPRKGRAPIKEINVLKNKDYLIFEYNRLVNSTQTSVVFTGVPLKYIPLINELDFLNQYVPEKSLDFIVAKKIVESLGERFVFYHLEFEE